MHRDSIRLRLSDSCVETRSRARPFTEEDRASIRRPEFQRRFWARVHKQPGDGCWLWTGGACSGYGVVFVRATNVRAHRVCWEMLVGPVPDDLSVLHDCDTRCAPGDISYRRCVRPDHLWLGTHAQNIRDLWEKERSTRAHINNRVALEIREEYFGSGRSMQAIARKFGISTTTVHQVVVGKRWAPDAPRL